MLVTNTARASHSLRCHLSINPILMPDTVFSLMYRETHTNSMCTYIVSNYQILNSIIRFADCALMSKDHKLMSAVSDAFFWGPTRVIGLYAFGFTAQ